MTKVDPKIPKQAHEAITRGASEFAKRKALQAGAELAKRQIDPLQLYVPTAFQDAAHRSTAKEVVVSGGNRAGKSLFGFMEDARAVRGEDPYDKYPKRDGVLAILGYKEWHIGNVIYNYLFKAGAFKIIRDEETMLWRVFRPWVPQDAKRGMEAKPAPPLIPPRFIEKIAWKDRAKSVFSNVRLTTGWEIKAFSSNTKPEQGYEADLFHIDEDIIFEQHYTEAIGRLIDRDGLLRWTALPHDDNDVLGRLHERAEDQEAEHARGGPKPDVIVFRGSMDENPYLSEKAKLAAMASWSSLGESEYRKRVKGELVTDTVLMYPGWSKYVHSVDEASELASMKTYLKKREVPRDWCLRLSVDPGFQTCAVTFWATPPQGNIHLCFDELYLHQCNAYLFAEEVKKKIRDRTYQTFIIDAHGGALTSSETGRTPREAYSRELFRHHVRSVDTDSNFVSGCDEIAYRETITREMLRIKHNGLPTILFDPQKCPNLDREMRRFRKQKIGDEVIDKGNRRANTHAVETLEYFCAFVDDCRNPYIAPPSKKSTETEGQRRVRLFRERMERRKKKKGRRPAVILAPNGA